MRDSQKALKESTEKATKLGKKPPFMKKAKVWIARASKLVLIPSTLVVIIPVFGSMALAIGLMFWNFGMLLIPLYLMLIVMFRVPLEAFWDRFGVGTPDPKTEGFNSKFEKFLIFISEGGDFKCVPRPASAAGFDPRCGSCL